MKTNLFLYFAIMSFAAFASACTSATAPGNSATGPNSNTASNIPPEFSGTPIAPDGKTTPGIPPVNQANLSNAPRGATPTPGIPDPATIGKTPVPKGATPTPGIPDPETLKKQATTIIKDANAVNRIPSDIRNAVNKGVKTVKKP